MLRTQLEMRTVLARYHNHILQNNLLSSLSYQTFSLFNWQCSSENMLGHATYCKSTDYLILILSSLHQYVFTSKLTFMMRLSTNMQQIQKCELKPTFSGFVCLYTCICFLLLSMCSWIPAVNPNHFHVFPVATHSRGNCLRLLCKWVIVRLRLCMYL